MSDKTEDTSENIIFIDPFKSGRIIIQLIQCRMLPLSPTCRNSPVYRLHWHIYKKNPGFDNDKYTLSRLKNQSGAPLWSAPYQCTKKKRQTTLYLLYIKESVNSFLTINCFQKANLQIFPISWREKYFLYNKSF